MKWYIEFLILWLILFLFFTGLFFTIPELEEIFLYLSVILASLLAAISYFCYDAIKKEKAKKVCGKCGKKLSLFSQLKLTHWGHLAYRCNDCTKEEKETIENAITSGKEIEPSEEIIAEMGKSPNILWRHGYILGIFASIIFYSLYSFFRFIPIVAGVFTVVTILFLNLLIIWNDKKNNMFDWVHSPMMTYASIFMLILFYLIEAGVI